MSLKRHKTVKINFQIRRNWSDSLNKSPQAVKTTDDVTPTVTPNAPPTQAQFKKDRKKSSTWFGAN
jgi:hypothetical protein